MFFILLQPFHIISLPVDIFLDSKLCQSYLYVNSLGILHMTWEIAKILKP